ncbi:MAG: prepilin-type N-terminal cleavage/methylation domain-containing protein [Planctomycetota bacterium]
MRRRGNAFTLIELLVVISIIALLIGILLPVLSNARQTTRLAVGLTNARSLAAGKLIQSQDNQGRLTRWAPGDAADWWAWGSQPKMHSHLATYWLGDSDPWLWGMLGELILFGYVEANDAFYSPADETPRDYVDADRGGHWSKFGNHVRSSYEFNPLRMISIDDAVSYKFTGTLTPLPPEEAFPFDMYQPSTAALVMDIKQGLNTVNLGDVGPGSRHRPHWNLAYLDGHAARTPQDIADVIQSRHTAGLDPYDTADDYREFNLEQMVFQGMSEADAEAWRP